MYRPRKQNTVPFFEVNKKKKKKKPPSSTSIRATSDSTIGIQLSRQKVKRQDRSVYLTPLHNAEIGARQSCCSLREGIDNRYSRETSQTNGRPVVNWKSLRARVIASNHLPFPSLTPPPYPCISPLSPILSPAPLVRLFVSAESRLMRH